MRLRSPRPLPDAGSTLLTALVVTGCIGLALGSYLHLVQSQNRLVMHSLSWNTALPMAEAGVEEAMTHLTRNGVSNLTEDGWTLLGSSGKYAMNRDLGDGLYNVQLFRSTSTYYWETNFTIRSTGYYRRPESTSHVERTVLVGVTQRMKHIGLVTKQGITLGGNFMADSFDSSDFAANTGGLYDPAKRKAGAFIGTNSRTNNMYTLVGSAVVSGYVATGPGGSVNAKGGSSVGDLAWTAAPTPGVQPGRFRDDANFQIPDVTLPPLVWAPVAPLTLLGTNYAGVLTGGAYSIGALTSGSVLLVTAPSTLYVMGNVTLDQLIIAPGGSLEMYVGGAQTTFNQLDINGTGNALDFMYYGLPSNKTITFSSDLTMVGCIYAPQAQVDMSGNGNYSGAICANSLKITGGFQYHFDENLSKNGPSYGLYITTWDER